jgi:signal transduction histidine kinase
MLPTPVHLDVRTGTLPDAVGTTAYFVASEALTNAVKHAGAETIRVEVSREADDLLVRVSDDGQGGAVLKSSAGLAGLQDRVAAMGGRFRVDSVEGHGTTVEALLPCE